MNSSLQTHHKMYMFGGLFFIPFEGGTTFLAPAWPLAWPGTQDDLGQGAKAQMGQGLMLVKKMKKRYQVLRMEFSIVGNISGPHENIFSLFVSPQLNSRIKSKTCADFIKFHPLPYFHT